MRKIQEVVVKLSYFGFTRTCGEVVVSECHVIPSPVYLIGCPVQCVGTANLVVKLSVTPCIGSRPLIVSRNHRIRIVSRYRKLSQIEDYFI